MEQTLKGGREWEGISSFFLHILAMALMLCDHSWATVVPGQNWLTWLGRIAYPIFAFMIVEGYFHTRDLKKYRRRLLLGAVLSEIPFNLMTGGSLLYPFHQNVMWTFYISLGIIGWMDRARKKNKVLGVAAILGLTFLGYLVGLLSMVDYNGPGVLTVILFYLCRGDRWYHRLGQAAGLWYINFELLRGMMVPLTLFGVELDIHQQGMAILALIPIWLYRGRQGPHSRTISLVYYAFYPVHIAVLVLIQSLL